MHWFHELPFNGVTEAHLRRLVEEQTAESLHLEFKQSLYPHKDGQERRRELAKDLSAFANASGGDVIIGISEDKDTNTANELTPLSASADEDLRWIRDVAKDAVEPRIRYQEREIRLADGRYVLHLRVPPSYHGPHRVCLNQNLFWLRHAKKAEPMSSSEIRDVVFRSATAQERAEHWRNERLAAHREKRHPYQLVDGWYSYFVHGIPLGTDTNAIDFADENSSDAIYQANILLRSRRRWNVDGVVLLSNNVETPTWIVQWFSDGRFEYARNPCSTAVVATDIEPTLGDLVVDNIKAIATLVGNTPWLVYVTLTGVKGMHYVPRRDSAMDGDRVFDREIVTLPVIALPEPMAMNEIWPEFKATFDRIAQAANTPKSHTIDRRGVPHEIVRRQG